MRTRVVVTGMGCISPLGNDVESLWSGLLAGHSGIGPITQYDASDFKVKIAAEVKGFDATARFGSREARRMDRFSQFALAAAIQAVQEAGLVVDDSDSDRVGVIIGTGIGGVGTIYEL